MLENIVSKKTIPADGVQRQWDIPFTFYKLSDVGFYVSYDNGKTIEKITQNIRYEKDGNYFVYPTEESKLPVLPVGATVLLLRETENKQLATSETFPFNSRDIEHMADNLTMQIQDLKRDSIRAVKTSLFTDESPEQFTERLFNAASDAAKSAAQAEASASNAKDSENISSANAEESRLNAQKTASDALLSVSASESAVAAKNEAKAHSDNAAMHAKDAKDVFEKMEEEFYNKEEMNAQISSISSSLSDIEKVIPSEANETNKLVSKQELFDAEMDLREDMNESDSDLQTQITAQASAISGKQNKLIAGANITIINDVISATGGGGGGGSAGSADVAEALRNQNEAEGATEHLYNWVGTLAEYEAQNIATEHPEWIVLITDDSGPGSGGGGGSSDAKWGTITGDINAQTDLTNLFNIQATAIAEKQDKLTAGEGIIIEDNVISATGGGGGSAEIPDNVYTSDNLIAGKNVTFTEVPPEGGIDEHTLACWHFDGSNVDSVASKSLSSAYLATDYFKFGTGSAYWWGGLASISTSYTNADATMDLWALLPSTSDSVTMTLDGQLYTSQGQIIWWVVKLEKNKIIFGKIPSLGGAITETASAYFSFPNTEFVHIAFQRSNNTNYQVFANGQKVIDVEIDELPSFNKIGLTSTTAARIDELRISDCVRYTEDFTPPTQAYTVATGPSKTAVNAVVAVPTKTSELENDSGFLTGLPDNVYTQTNLLGGKDIEIVPEPVEGGIDEYALGVFHFDDSANPTKNAVEGGFSPSTNKNIISTYSKFGGYATDKASFYTTTSLSETDDWTIDGWYYMLGNSYRLGQGISNNSSPTDVKTDSFYLCISYNLLDTNYPVRVYKQTTNLAKAQTTWSLNEWHHIATEKHGKTITGYIDGFPVISYTGDDVKNSIATKNLISYGPAYMDELRFSNIARYKGQPFTPPNKAYEVAEPTGNMVVNFVGESLQKGADYVVESYNEGTNWYRVYKSGWVEQGGIVQSDASAAKTFSFLKPFADGNYTLIAHVDSTDNYVKSANTHTLTSTSFIYKVVTDGGGLLAMTIRWRAEGKGA